MSWKDIFFEELPPFALFVPFLRIPFKVDGSCFFMVGIAFRSFPES